MAIELVSFDDLKDLLGLNKTEGDYADLAIIQPSVVSAFESHTRRVFTEDDYEEELFVGPLSTKMIPLKGLPINAITEVTIDDVVTESYKISVYGAELDTKVKNQVVKVKYNGGLSSVPRSLNRAALLQTAYEYQNKNSIGLEVVSSPGGNIVKPQVGMLKEVEKLLNEHIHPFPEF